MANLALLTLLLGRIRRSRRHVLFLAGRRPMPFDRSMPSLGCLRKAPLQITAKAKAISGHEASSPRTIAFVDPFCHVPRSVKTETETSSSRSVFGIVKTTSSSTMFCRPDRDRQVPLRPFLYKTDPKRLGFVTCATTHVQLRRLAKYHFMLARPASRTPNDRRLVDLVQLQAPNTRVAQMPNSRVIFILNPRASAPLSVGPTCQPPVATRGNSGLAYQKFGQFGSILEKEDHWSKNKHGVDGMRKGNKNGVASDDLRTLKPP
ncbi:hypothetical protein TRIUR3_28985 [Triticum urartu]|uniref:Uncharacterized protein n=1 Tax=Triticum urartu TaxID=4572 RepID=M7Z1D2_TRIUA|nr:hypothetical protein TRIUR3_28985 [Triticum urartu]